MAYYYKYNFISPEPIYATIREEFKSYFDSGSVDDLMFPTYVDKCLRKLGRGTYYITEDILNIEDYEARLPDNFYAVREAWLCTEVQGYPYRTANSFYSQAASASTIQIAPMTVNGNPCVDNPCHDPYCDDCMPQLVQAVYKTNSEFTRTYKREYLLKPGNISARNNCDVDYIDTWEMYTRPALLDNAIPFSSDYDSFDIRDNKFVTNFRYGVVNLVFYAIQYDDTGNQMIPDNYYVREYIEAFIKFKLLEQITNQVMDETFQQLQTKLVYYEQKSNEAYILALTEMRRRTMWEKQRDIKRGLNRLKRFELPVGRNRYAWRRNS